MKCIIVLLNDIALGKDTYCLSEASSIGVHTFNCIIAYNDGKITELAGCNYLAMSVCDSGGLRDGSCGMTTPLADKGELNYRLKAAVIAVVRLQCTY